jgi:hypothetical protein
VKMMVEVSRRNVTVEVQMWTERVFKDGKNRFQH